MKKLLLIILLSSIGISEAVRRKIPSMKILQYRFQGKLGYFIGKNIIEKLADQVIESDAVTSTVNKLLDESSSDNVPVAHLMQIFEVTPLLVEAILKDSSEIPEELS